VCVLCAFLLDNLDERERRPLFGECCCVTAKNIWCAACTRYIVSGARRSCKEEGYEKGREGEFGMCMFRKNKKNSKKSSQRLSYIIKERKNYRIYFKSFFLFFCVFFEQKTVGLVSTDVDFVY
jgi:hypothetical protein